MRPMSADPRVGAGAPPPSARRSAQRGRWTRAARRGRRPRSVPGGRGLGAVHRGWGPELANRGRGPEVANRGRGGRAAKRRRWLRPLRRGRWLRPANGGGVTGATQRGRRPCPREWSGLGGPWDRVPPVSRPLLDERYHAERYRGCQEQHDHNEERARIHDAPDRFVPDGRLAPPSDARRRTLPGAHRVAYSRWSDAHRTQAAEHGCGPAGLASAGRWSHNGATPRSPVCGEERAHGRGVVDS